MSLKKYLMLCLAVMTLPSCSFIRRRSEMLNSFEQERQASFLYRATEIEINKADKALMEGQYRISYELFQDFQAQYPNSSYLQAARLGEAQSLEGLEQYVEAEVIYRDIYLKSIQSFPSIAALAAYRLSFVYEALGEDLKSLTALLDSKKLSQYLPDEVVKAALPARLAATYVRMGNDKEGFEYLQQADRGVNQLMNDQASKNLSWLGQIYFQMGTVSTNQLSVDNFEQSAEVQKMLQVYLIKAMGLNLPNWSSRSLAQVKVTYQDFLNTLSLPINNLNKKNQMGGSLIDMIEQAELFKPLDAQSDNSFQKDFFSFLEAVKKKTEVVLYQLKETHGLTAEALERHKIKRLGRRTLKELNEAERKTPAQPVHVPPTEDPNL